MWTHCICEICLLRNKFDQPGPVTPLYISENVFPAENQIEVHIIGYVCDVSCLYICIQTNMSEFCPLEYICKTNKKTL